MITIPVKRPKIYRTGYFIRKPGTMKFLIEDLHTHTNYPEDFMIEEIIIVNSEEWTSFHQDFYADKEYLKGKGGTYSTTSTPELEEKYPSWTDEELEQFREGAYRKCVAIFEGVFEDGEIIDFITPHFTIVDPQGYSYARYVTLSEFYGKVNEKGYLRLLDSMVDEILEYETPTAPTVSRR